MSAENSTGMKRQSCPGCGAEQPTIATTCRECGASLLETESGGRRWLRVGAVGAVVVLGALGTFLAITTLWEPHEEPETDIAWAQGLGAVRDLDRPRDGFQPPRPAATEAWHAAPADEVVLLASRTALRGVAHDNGRVVWRTTVEETGDVYWPGPPIIEGGTAYVAAGSSLHAVDTTSGETRWTVTEDGVVFRLLEATTAGLAVAVSPTEQGRQPTIVLLDAETGDERWRDEWGNTDVLVADRDRLYGTTVEHRWEEGASPDEPVETVVGRTVAWDLATGEQVWEVETEDLHRVPVAAEGVAVVRDNELTIETEEGRAWQEVGLAGLDPADGGEIWRWEPSGDTTIRHITPAGEGRLAFIGGGREGGQDGLVVLDTSDGEERWRSDLLLGASSLLAATPRDVFVVGDVRDEGTPVWAFDVERGEQRWEVHLGTEGAVTGLAADERGVYVLDEGGGLHRLDPDDGTTRWRTAAAAESEQPAPAVHDGHVYVVGGDGHLRVFDVDGEEVWSARIGTSGFSQPIVSDLGAFVVTGLGSLRAIDLETGEERWRTDSLLERLLDQAPRPVVLDELVVATAGDTVFAADAADGGLRWETGLPAQGRQVGLRDGILVVVDESGALHVLDPDDGSVRWSDHVGGGVVAASVVDGSEDGSEDGSGIVVLTIDGELRLVDAEDGDTRWGSGLEDPVPVAPAVSDGGLVIVVDGGSVRAIDLGSGEQHWVHDALQALAGAVTVGDGLVHAATAGTAVLVLDAGDGSLVRQLDVGRLVTSSPAVLHERVIVRAGEHLVALE